MAVPLSIACCQNRGVLGGGRLCSINGLWVLKATKAKEKSQSHRRRRTKEPHGSPLGPKDILCALLDLDLNTFAPRSRFPLPVLQGMLRTLSVRFSNTFGFFASLWPLPKMSLAHLILTSFLSTPPFRTSRFSFLCLQFRHYQKSWVISVHLSTTSL